MPTVSELLRERAPRASSAADDLEGVLRSAARGVRGMAAELGIWAATSVESDDVEALDDERAVTASLRGAGILSTGVTRLPATGEYAPAIVVRADRPVLRISVEPDDAGNHLGRVWTVLREVGIGPGDAVLIALPEPVAQAGPSGEAHCGGPPGTFGARVHDQHGQRGLLTAGHVAPRTGAGAYTTGATYVGTVAQAYDIAPLPPRMPGLDVALVELSATTPDTVTTPCPQSSTPGDVWDTVVAYGARSQAAPGMVLCAGRPFAGPSQQHGHWDEALITDQPISVGGDSGGMVVNSTTGELVGHIVGGYPGRYSVIQDAEAQLRRLGATLR